MATAALVSRTLSPVRLVADELRACLYIHQRGGRLSSRWCRVEDGRKEERVLVLVLVVVVVLIVQ